MAAAGRDPRRRGRAAGVGPHGQDPIGAEVAPGSGPVAAPDGRGGPHLFVEDLGRPALSPDDAHHLVRVLRTSTGDPVTVSDGDGRWAPAVLADEDGTLEVTGAVVELAPAASPVTIAFVPVKGDRPEWVVQKLTEIGVDHVVVARSARSVVRWSGERADRQLERLRRVGREAAMQSRRCRLPQIDGVREATDLLGGAETALAEPGGDPLDGTERALLVGPEGGWDDDERARADRAVSLGPSVLRAETAAVVGAALLVGFRDGRLRSTTNSG